MKRTLPLGHVIILWNRGKDTAEIARSLGFSEACVANALARMLDARAVSFGASSRRNPVSSSAV